MDDTFYTGEQAVIDELIEAQDRDQAGKATDVYLPDFNDSITPKASASR